jgi:hypothetical protein
MRTTSLGQKQKLRLVCFVVVLLFLGVVEIELKTLHLLGRHLQPFLF